MAALAERLRDLAGMAERGELPETALRRLSRAVALAERDYCILAASRVAGSTTALLDALGRDGWRIDVWRQRGRAPEIANPILLALYRAGTLPCARQIQRILRHPVSDDVA